MSRPVLPIYAGINPKVSPNSSLIHELPAMMSARLVVSLDAMELDRIPATKSGDGVLACGSELQSRLVIRYLH